MSIWSTLFKSSDLVNAVIKTGDALVFTDEEKKEMHLKQLEAYAPFKIAQRWMMMAVVPAYVLMSVVMFICLMSGVGNPESASQVLSGQLGWGFVAIVAFYTGGGAAEGIVNKFKGN